ncbi:MAG: N-acetylneuraminate synthase family protein [Planctomycetes bacterium]|nr:N-acetylneuraminate synthase family protein [Planctomycetota bacterium]
MQVQIIAELAQGFEGRPEQTRMLLKAAAAAGADAAKYQLVYADELATPDYKHYELFRSLEMPDKVWLELAAYAKELGIQLHLDIFGPKSLKLAERCGVSAVKLHGTDIANLGLLELVAASSVGTVLLGAGGAHADELKRAMQVLARKKVVALLGFQSYPTPNDTNQISRIARVLKLFAKDFPQASVGFADHADPECPLRYALAATAIGAGATTIEKHLTLAGVMKLEDHESALNPDAFAEFVAVIRDCAKALGHSSDANDFGMSESERAYRKMIRRHVVAGRDIPAGSALKPNDLALKRTAADDALTSLDEAYGREVLRDVGANQPMTPATIRAGAAK